MAQVTIIIPSDDMQVTTAYDKPDILRGIPSFGSRPRHLTVEEEELFDWVRLFMVEYPDKSFYLERHVPN